MSVRQLGFAVVGLGAISRMHLESISSLPTARLVSVVARNPERAQRVADEYGCDAYTDYRQALDRKDVDVVTILTPSGARRDIALDAAAAGKHVIAEKPLEITVKRIDEMIAACDKAGVVLAGIFQFRFKPAWRYLKRAASEGRLGRLFVGDAYNKWYRTREYYASASWRGTWELDGGGALMNQGIHVVDLLQWIMGDVEEITAYVRTLRHSIEAEDTAAAILRYRNGAVGVIEATTSVYPGYPMSVEVHGERGTVKVAGDWITDWSVQDTTEDELREVGRVFAPEASQSTASDPAQTDPTWHRMQIADIVDSILEGREPAVPGREARKSVQIIEAIYQSSREGKPVKLL